MSFHRIPRPLQKIKKTMNQNLLKKKVIKVAARCFQEYGIKNTTMNFISQMLHISKRTLYQLFPSKNELLKACISFRLEANKKQIKEKCNMPNPVDAIIRMNCEAYAFTRTFYLAFRKDIQN